MWGERLVDWAYGVCGYGPSFGHGPWFFGWLFPLFFWGLVIFGMFTIVRSLFWGNKRQQGDSALEILRNRFASGELSEREYSAQKAVLGK